MERYSYIYQFSTNQFKAGIETQAFDQHVWFTLTDGFALHVTSLILL